MSNKDEAGPSKKPNEDHHPRRSASTERGEVTPSTSSKFQATMFKGTIYFYSFECVNKSKRTILGFIYLNTLICS